MSMRIDKKRGVLPLEVRLSGLVGRPALVGNGHAAEPAEPLVQRRRPGSWPRYRGRGAAAHMVAAPLHSTAMCPSPCLWLSSRGRGSDTLMAKCRTPCARI